MNIAIIGTGNAGGTLAAKWAHAGHNIRLGVKDKANFKGKHLAEIKGISVHSITEAVELSEIVLVSTPATAAAEVARSLGNTEGKIIIDTMNIVMGRGPEGFSNTADAILANTLARDVVKCFNTTGAENMQNPDYDGVKLDMFMAGSSIKGKQVAEQLAKDAGFGEVYDMGGNDKFFLIEQLANVWINQAIFMGAGRNIGFKIIKRK